jgi:hypothetical protein
VDRARRLRPASHYLTSLDQSQTLPPPTLLSTHFAKATSSRTTI